MKEFPRDQFEIVRNLRQSKTLSTYVVKPRGGDAPHLLLKVFSGFSANKDLRIIEDDLCWQRGLVHPYLLGIERAGVFGKDNVYVARQFSSNHFDLLNVSPAHIQQLIDAVRFLHRHSRVHGQIKPSNIFLVDDTVRLADLRLADFEESSDFDDIRFSAPEVLAGGSPTVESDYYSLGAILYRIYARRDPFDDKVPENLRAKYLHAKPLSLQNYKGVPDPLAKAIDGLLHRNPHHRVVAFRSLIRVVPFEPAPVSRAPMIGRHDLLESLLSKLSVRTGGTLCVHLVEGEAGIGKSRLIEELQFVSEFRNFHLFISSCAQPTEQSLSPIIRLIRQVLQKKCERNRISFQQALGHFAEALTPLFEAGSEVGVDRSSERVVHALIGLLSAISRDTPLRFCIEDVDRADPISLLFLKQICYRASELNIHLILTCRSAAALNALAEMDSLLGRHAFVRFPVASLTKSDSRYLLLYLVPRKGKQADDLMRANGNPMWLIEHARTENSEAQTQHVYTTIREKADALILKLVQAIAACGVPASGELLARVIGCDLDAVTQGFLWLKEIGAVYELNERFQLRIETLRPVITADCSARTLRSIHQAFYRFLQADANIEIAALAEHAFRGGLWEQASTHYASLTCAASDRGDNASALEYFGRLKKLLQKLHQSVPPEVEVAVATCLAQSGKAKVAEQIFERLLKESNISSDMRSRLTLTSRGAQMDCVRLDQRLKLLRQTVESKAYGGYHPAALLGALATASARDGDMLGAEAALKQANASLELAPNPRIAQSVRSVEAFYLLGIGAFRVASEKFRKVSLDRWNLTAAVLLNRGVCFRHLGSIRTAMAFHQKADRLACKANHLYGQLVSLSNLMENATKLGQIKDAHSYFQKARQLALNGGEAADDVLGWVDAEKAGLDAVEGRYACALQGIHSVRNRSALYKYERLEHQIREYEIQLDAGMEIKTSDVTSIVNEHSWSPSPLYIVQLALLRSRTELVVQDAVATLKTALDTAKTAELLYEVCRLELELSSRLYESDPAGAKPHAEEALQISKKNGYRPLQARALMLRGLCGVHEKEREHYFILGLSLATEVGIPEIISESAYHLGVLYQSQKKLKAAQEHFANSTRVISDLVEHVPAKYRANYVAKPWRQDARRRFEECQKPADLSVLKKQPVEREHPYFRALYGISTAATLAQSVDMFVRDVMTAVGRSRDSIVVMLKFDDHLGWHSLGVTVTDELRKLITATAAKAQGQPLYESRSRWIPFRSQQHSGGIYVVCRKRRTMEEDELEFFTMLGSFVSGAIDQIHSRTATKSIAVSTTTEFQGIVGGSRVVREMCAHIETIAKNNATVLIQGETGTGKELVARAIHRLSPRAKAPFIAVDCGAIPEGLIESELFGSKRGSFTGAVADRAGVFEAAHGGTLFLDEISNMNLSMQARLLRVLQEREVRRVGETHSRAVDVRLIAATNNNLRYQVEQGTFRQDLLFRLNVIEVNIAALRSRREDVPMLVAHFLKQLNSENNTSKVLGPHALDMLLAYNFPGNIRELRNVVERGFFMARGQTITSIPVERSSGEAAEQSNDIDDVRKMFTDLAEGRRNFWTAIHDRYKQRDIPREKVVALVDLGLRKTSGSYKELASLFRIDDGEYRRLMDFLRRNNCLLDFRPYRKVASLS